MIFKISFSFRTSILKVLCSNSEKHKYKAIGETSKLNYVCILFAFSYAIKIDFDLITLFIKETTKAENSKCVHIHFSSRALIARIGTSYWYLYPSIKLNKGTSYWNLYPSNIKLKIKIKYRYFILKPLSK